MVHKRILREKFLSVITIDGKLITVTETEDFYHFRMRDPSMFIRVRTLDIGRPRKHQIRRGMTKAGKWLTQSVLIEKERPLRQELASAMTKDILTKAVRYQ